MKFIHQYLDNIKKKAYKDIYNLENTVLSKNPYISEFILNYINKKNRKNPNFLFILKNIFLFYIKNSIHFLIYIVQAIVYKLVNKKNYDFKKDSIVIDVFFLVDKIIKDKKFTENYFSGLYDVLKSNNKQYVFLPRLHMNNKNPLNILKLMQILNKDKNNFVFEFDLLSFIDFLRIIKFIILYPFNVISLLQKGNSKTNKLFNYEIVNSLSNTSHTAYTRYLMGKKLANNLPTDSKIISWMEFQNIEKSFNRAIKESSKKITVYGCQFSIYYKEYISMHITDIDYDCNITPDIVLLNGKYNYSDAKQQVFQNGVSLRYKNIFNNNISNIIDKENTLVLLTYQIKESIQLLEYAQNLKNVVLKIHPTTNISQFNKYIKNEWIYSELTIYQELEKAKIAIVGSMSGTGLEAVSCGISVIIVASKNTIISNPLVSHGKGKIWDIAYDIDEFQLLYDNLLEYRNKNLEEINEIASWYKDNFFVEPTEVNILNTFKLNKGLK